MSVFSSITYFFLYLVSFHFIDPGPCFSRSWKLAASRSFFLSFVANASKICCLQRGWLVAWAREHVIFLTHLCSGCIALFPLSAVHVSRAEVATCLHVLVQLHKLMEKSWLWNCLAPTTQQCLPGNKSAVKIHYVPLCSLLLKYNFCGKKWAVVASHGERAGYWHLLQWQCFSLMWHRRTETGGVVGRGKSLLNRWGLLAFSWLLFFCQLLALQRSLHQHCWLATKPALKL